MFTAILPLRTERLLLRPVADGDLPRLVEILGDPEVMKLALYERALTEPEVRDFIESDFTKDVRDPMHLGVLCRAQDRTIIGFAGLLPCKYFPGDLEIGFVLATEHQRCGYATEIGNALMDVCFHILRRDRLIGLCDPRNEESRKVLTKLGMSEIEEIRTADRGCRSVFATYSPRS
jgi:RimJ/RimL family protein N-acetyltransferase